MTEAPDDEPIEPRQMLGSGFVVYGLMMAGALVWLAMRDRTDAFAEQAIGARGPWLGAAAGLGGGIALAFGLQLLRRVSPELRRLDAMVVQTFTGVGDGTALLFVTSGALAEEMLFRLAVQDAFGLPGSVALHVLLYSSAGGWRWLLFLLPQALVLGLLVQTGFGLLASTSANAIMNHLNLKRLRCD